MNVEANILFKPARRRVLTWIIFIAVAMFFNIYFLLKSSGIILYFPLTFLFMMFLILLMSVFKNQKISISGDNIDIYSFGRKNRLKFSKNIEEIVVKDSEIVSYRFEKDGKYYQISPYAYYRDNELKILFKNLMKETKNSILVVEW